MAYDHKIIEKKWQKKWLKEAVNHPDSILSGTKPFYNLWMFPYPSAEGLHAGHAFSSTGSDIYGRFKRMNGHEVFQPIGYDSFGIHSENYALKIGEHPEKMLVRTTQNYAQQLQSLGHGYDWTRTVTTSDAEYYKWTQWLFIELFKAGLAYRKKASVNWCPSCKTVLSDEQVVTPAQAGKDPKNTQGEVVAVVDGMQVCERCGTLIEHKDLEQWFFRITAYADKLLENLSKLAWPEKIKTAQHNWIGKKEGITISYPVKYHENLSLDVWTSRPDTNFGATFIVIAPEHPLALKLTEKEHIQNVKKYIKKIQSISKDERISEGKEKTGVFTGSYAVNKLNGRELPIWISDFVLMSVGTGAVVGVPGHDKRDFEFASNFKLPIVRVVTGEYGDMSEITDISKVQEETGKMINSDFLNGLEPDEAILKMMDFMEEKGWGKRENNYHLRDWLISRQRYWGPPIPMIYCEKCANAGKSWFESEEADRDEDKVGNKKLETVNLSDWSAAGWYPDDNLPITLPHLDDYKPEGDGRGPLAKLPEFYKTKCPSCGGEATRETDVSDTFLDSSWYFLRYPSVGSESASKMPFDREITNAWLPVNLYFGGAEHAVLHLMYARFITMVLADLGYISFEEPFPRFFAHGLMIKDGAKMSKSRGNVVNPDEYIRKFGADTMRLYLMFMGPMDGFPDFRDTGIEGMKRFTERVWNLLTENKEPNLDKKDSDEVETVMHKTIKKVTEDISDFRYNTAIAALMEFVNLLREKANSKGTNLKNNSDVWKSALKNLTLMIAPFAPHLAEEVWVSHLKKDFSIHRHAWPSFDLQKTVESTVITAVQVNGKLRGTLELETSIASTKTAVVNAAKNEPVVAKWLEGQEIVNTIFVPLKLINFVLK